MSSQELVIQAQAQHGEPTAIQRASDFMPVFDIRLAVERKRAMTEFIGQILNVDADYGQIPGTQKPTLLKPGAEKLASFFGLSPRFIYDQVIENWGADGGEPMFYYRVKCRLMKGDRVIGEADGACSSWESRYRYRWVTEDQLGGRKKEGLRSRGGVTTLTEPAFAIDKAETTGKYGKPQPYWDRFRAGIQDGTARRAQKTTKAGKPMDAWAIQVDETFYQIPNPDIYDQVNTILKMAEKRALVAAVLIATNASDSFTQDLEDIDTGGAPLGTRETQENVRDHKVEELKKAQFAFATPGPAMRPAGGQTASDQLYQPRGEWDAPPEAQQAQTPQPQPGPKPVPPPPPPSGDEVPEAVQTLWRAMGTKVGPINSAFLQLKEAIGEQNADEYWGILSKHGMDSPTDCMRVGINKTRICIWDLWRAAERIKAEPGTAEVGRLFDDMKPEPVGAGAYGEGM